MAEIVMPRLSDSMEEGTVLKWMKGVGDEVAVGDELVEIETDKANMAYESDVAGTLTEILAPEGETLEIGAPIARVGERDDDAGAPSAPAPSTPAAEEPPAEAPRLRRPAERRSPYSDRLASPSAGRQQIRRIRTGLRAAALECLFEAELGELLQLRDGKDGLDCCRAQHGRCELHQGLAGG